MSQSAMTAFQALGLSSDPTARPRPGRPASPQYQAGLGPFTLTPDEAQSYMRATQSGSFDPVDLVQTKRPELEQWLTNREAAQELTPLYRELGGDYASAGLADLPYFQGQQIAAPASTLQGFQEGRPLAALPGNVAVPSDPQLLPGYTRPDYIEALRLAATRYPHLVNSLQSIGVATSGDPDVGGNLAYTNPASTGESIRFSPDFMQSPLDYGVIMNSPAKFPWQQVGPASILDVMNHELTHAAMDRFGYLPSEQPPSQAEMDFLRALGLTPPASLQRAIRGNGG